MGAARGHSEAMAHITMGDIDLLHPPRELEQRRHKLKRLVQSPNSFFMDVKCPGCFNITTVFSHAQTVVICSGCSTVLCQPTGVRERGLSSQLPHPIFLRWLHVTVYIYLSFAPARVCQSSPAPR